MTPLLFNGSETEQTFFLKLFNPVYRNDIIPEMPSLNRALQMCAVSVRTDVRMKVQASWGSLKEP